MRFLRIVPLDHPARPTIVLKPSGTNYGLLREFLKKKLAENGNLTSVELQDLAKDYKLPASFPVFVSRHDEGETDNISSIHAK